MNDMKALMSAAQVYGSLFFFLSPKRLFTYDTKLKLSPSLSLIRSLPPLSLSLFLSFSLSHSPLLPAFTTFFLRRLAAFIVDFHSEKLQPWYAFSPLENSYICCKVVCSVGWLVGWYLVGWSCNWFTNISALKLATQKPWTCLISHFVKFTKALFT